MPYITLFTASADPLKNDNIYEKAYLTVSPLRRAKTDKLRFGKDKRLSLAAELLLFTALEKNGIETENTEISYGENGKPYMSHRNDVFFNLSHSGEYVLAAVSDYPVGCDIEKVEDINLNIAKRFFTREEYEEIIKNDKAGANDLFFRYWTVKESFMKLTGLGMKLPLDAFTVDLKSKTIIGGAPKKGTFYFEEFGAVDGYKIAVASEKNCGKAKIITVDLSEV